MSRSEAATSVVSPVLWAAQQRLLALREQHQVHMPAAVAVVAASTDGRSQKRCAEELRETGESCGDLIAQLPEHLGWESVRVTAVCRSISSHNDEGADSSWCQDLVAERVETAVSTSPTPLSHTGQSGSPSPPHVHETIKLYPSLALAMLREGQVAAGRIWLLLRHVDKAGRGWVDVAEARAHLCDKQSPLRVCGWRQLRKLLAAGEGIFWQREGARLWLRSACKVAAALHVVHLSGKPVALPIAILTEAMGTVRAHFYASFHSGRDGKRPIARQTLQQLGGICAHTQRDYEKRAQVKKQRNFAIGPKTGSVRAENAAWQQGSACFELTDHEGQLGKPGMSYLAWQLPNSYCGPHVQQSRGGQKRLNRELADLQTQGTAGNDQNLASKRFYGDGQLAAKAFNQGKVGIYWQEHAGRWFWLGGGD